MTTEGISFQITETIHTLLHLQGIISLSGKLCPASSLISLYCRPAVVLLLAPVMDYGHTRLTKAGDNIQPNLQSPVQSALYSICGNFMQFQYYDLYSALQSWCLSSISSWQRIREKAGKRRQNCFFFFAFFGFQTLRIIIN